jgi:hypothetical protein
MANFAASSDTARLQLVIRLDRDARAAQNIRPDD